MLVHCDLFGSNRSRDAMLVFDTATVRFTPAIAEQGSWCVEVEAAAPRHFVVVPVRNRGK